MTQQNAEQYNVPQVQAFNRLKEIKRNLDQIIGQDYNKTGKDRKIALEACADADNKIVGVVTSIQSSGKDDGGKIAQRGTNFLIEVRTLKDKIAAFGTASFSVDLLAAINAGQEELITKKLRDFYVSNPARHIKHPLLVGPAGCGKTFSVRKVFVDDFQPKGFTGFFETSIYPAITGADLLGVKIPSGTGVVSIDGDWTLAFNRAQAGEKVLVFVDELFRGNSAVQDFLVGAVVKMPAANAAAMGIQLPANSTGIYTAQAPIFGRIWCPAENVRFIFAGNPWGAPLDPAMGNRFSMIPIGFSELVADTFDEPIRSIIKASWKCGSPDGEIRISLPISYRDILEATSPSDRSFLSRYFDSLKIIDPVAASLFINKFASKI